jgi:hypothetical protein
VINGLPIHGMGHYMQSSGNAYWESHIQSVLSFAEFLPQPDFWNHYHRLCGSIHCGTATKRTIDFSTPWWEQLNEWP